MNFPTESQIFAGNLPNFGDHSIAFYISIASVLLVLICLALWKLYKILNHALSNFFAKHAMADNVISRRLSIYAGILAVWLPVLFIGTGIWLRTIQSNGEIKSSFGGMAVFMTIHLIFLLVLSRLSLYFSRCYVQSGKAEGRPIKGLIYSFNVVLLLFAFVLIASTLARQRPLIMLSSFGAAIAVFMFAFQNIVISLIANVQINNNQTAKIGDWISIPKYDIDGFIEKITVNSISVRQWDKSLVTFPVRYFTEEVVFNYESMCDSGARLIDYSIHIEQQTVRFLNSDEIAQLLNAGLIDKTMLNQCESLFATNHNTAQNAEKMWTNLDLFCLHAESYLKSRPDIRKDELCYVCGLGSAVRGGLPLQIYCYTTCTSVLPFSKVQGAVICHLLAMLPSFYLHVQSR